MSSSSSSMTSASFAKPTKEGPEFCFCELEAVVRYSKTERNPGRPFLGCPKYNTKGLPCCKFFKWADSNDDCEHHCQHQFREIYAELLKKEKELEKKEKELELREISIRRSRALLRLYWAFVVVVYCYYVVFN
ncbi:uncharacterized protein LOC122309352 [Carya illinoinensis]|uniref:uncharacterized protein LOC122309352 n=1 Tax=Carya illinoinensis TaxID=32201 RepID=UPI001C7263EE|nr:uncharacterized protein LOC122309352 [Carya illinoinensis]